MSFFYTSHFHDGCYDTRFCMPFIFQHPFPYYVPPLPILPHPTWIHPPQLQEKRPPYEKRPATNQQPTCVPSPPVPRPIGTRPNKRPLRSILKHSRSIPSDATKTRTVRFTPSTTSPTLAAPGTYKYAGTPKSPKLRHPARSHPCLIHTTPQQDNKPVAPVQCSSPTTSSSPRSTKSAPNTSNRTHQLPTRHISRPPTPPPAAFFRQPDQTQASAQPQPATPRPAVTSKASTQRQQAPPEQPIPTHRTHKPTVASTAAYARSYNGDSADTYTDVCLARQMVVKKEKPKPKQTAKKVEAKVQAAMGDMVDTETKRSLRALAREFDRKHAGRREGHT